MRGHGHDNLRGAAFLVAAGLLFTAEVVIVRLVATEAAQAQVVFTRGLAQLVMVLAFVAATGRWASLRTERPRLQALRGAVSVTSWWLYYTSFFAIDLALATVLGFTSSLWVVAFAGLFLGERVGPARVAATLVGFAGVALATRLGTVAFDPIVLFGVASAMCGAGVVFLNRVLTRTETTVSISFWIGFVATLASLPVMLWAWRPIEPGAFALLLVSGLVGAIGNVLVTEGYRAGEASALAPIPFLKIAWAMLAGVVLFAEAPAWQTVLGSLVVVGAALGVARIEAMAKRARARAAE